MKSLYAVSWIMIPLFDMRIFAKFLIINRNTVMEGETCHCAFHDLEYILDHFLRVDIGDTFSHASLKGRKI